MTRYGDAEISSAMCRSVLFHGSQRSNQCKILCYYLVSLLVSFMWFTNHFNLRITLKHLIN